MQGDHAITHVTVSDDKLKCPHFLVIIPIVGRLMVTLGWRTKIPKQLRPVITLQLSARPFLIIQRFLP